MSDAILTRIRREGSITFDAFMELALYCDGAFFATGRGAGRSGRDFVTSPETGSLFGALVARALTEEWRALGEPDPFFVIECGAGNGRLAREVLRAQPAFLGALRYVLVERSAVLRHEQLERLALEPPEDALGGYARAHADDAPEPVLGLGPVFTQLAELPALHIDGVIFANELLDNLPFGVAEYDGEQWNEVRISVDGERLVEVLVATASADADQLPLLPASTRVPLPRGLDAWFEAAAPLLRRGAMLLIDYVVDWAELVARDGAWLRTYRDHGLAGDPLAEPGDTDITGDVVLEQLEHAAARAGLHITANEAQADWLGRLGIGDLVAQGERVWRERAHIGDLEALAARSVASEAAALTDQAGLGAHRVIRLQR